MSLVSKKITYQVEGKTNQEGLVVDKIRVRYMDTSVTAYLVKGKYGSADIIKPDKIVSILD